MQYRAFRFGAEDDWQDMFRSLIVSVKRGTCKNKGLGAELDWLVVRVGLGC
jgi:hypothetical protein